MAARGGSGAMIPSGLDLHARVRVNFPDPEGSVHFFFARIVMIIFK